ncbi:MAG: methylmalonyl Co-A mutase-associated GTPase MeaB [Candidatus Zixiibacteriota bacterium]
MKLPDSFFAGDIRALSRTISLVEDGGEGYQAVLGSLYERRGKSIRIGITGPPGAGKSSLVNCLASLFLAQKKKVGIIAVDPTSPFTGGALLGDRVRMNDYPIDGSIFFRSMATRGATGGLADSTNDVTVIYEAYGFDVTMIETVGVGQVELDIIDNCDVVVVVMVPESGDSVQTMKAGLMEIANVFAVNKVDRPGSERLVSELQHTLSLRKKSDNWIIPVIGTDAVNRTNVDTLFTAINDYVAHAESTGIFESRRRDQMRHKVLNVLKHRFQAEFLNGMAEKIEFEKRIDEILLGKSNPFVLSDELYARFIRLQE